MDTKSLIKRFLWEEKLPDTYRQSIERFFMPAANGIISEFQKSKDCYIVGVNGCQGSGKTTLSRFLETYFNELGLNALSISIDDFYLSRADRELLAEETHPLLATRGVPGTHDMSELRHVILKLRKEITDFTIPKFSKALDDRLPIEDGYYVSEPVDILLVEGWCWGARAQSASALSQPVNALEEKEDIDGSWRAYVNDALRNEFEPLYRYVDRWLMLCAPGFDCVYRWRLEQEEKLREKLAADQDNLEENHAGLMTPKQIQRFIQYYQRVTESVLRSLPNEADVVWRLGQNREIQTVVCTDEMLMLTEGIE